MGARDEAGQRMTMSFTEWMDAGRPKTASLGDAGFIPAPARPEQGQRAGLLTRLVAAGIDVGATVLVIAGVWIGLRLVLWAAVPVASPEMPDISWFLLGGLVLLWLSWTIAYATNGRALGHVVMGIRVIGRNGGSMSWLPAALRALLNIAFSLGILWIIVSAQNRSLQDVLLRSSVIYAWASPRLKGDDVL